jgi:hypothetical protein
MQWHCHAVVRLESFRQAVAVFLSLPLREMSFSQSRSSLLDVVASTRQSIWYILIVVVGCGRWQSSVGKLFRRHDGMPGIAAYTIARRRPRPLRWCRRHRLFDVRRLQHVVATSWFWLQRVTSLCEDIFEISVCWHTGIRVPPFRESCCYAFGRWLRRTTFSGSQRDQGLQVLVLGSLATSSLISFEKDIY